MGHLIQVSVLILVVSAIAKDFNLFAILLGVEIFSLSRHEYQHHPNGRFRSIGVMLLGIAIAIIAIFFR
jgi:hypothetical protein